MFRWSNFSSWQASFQCKICKFFKEAINTAPIVLFRCQVFSWGDEWFGFKCHNILGNLWIFMCGILGSLCGRQSYKRLVCVCHVSCWSYWRGTFSVFIASWGKIYRKRIFIVPLLCSDIWNASFLSCQATFSRIGTKSKTQLQI